MQINEVRPGDLALLKQKARCERNAKQRDRFRAVAMAIEGMTTPAIMDKLDRSKNFVQRWSYAYRDGGIEAIIEKQRSGRPVKLSAGQEAAFKERITDGPTDVDMTCTLRGTDARAILEKEFGVQYSLPGVYALMHRLGLSCLKPGRNTLRMILKRCNNGSTRPSFCPKRPSPTPRQRHPSLVPG